MEEWNLKVSPPTPQEFSLPKPLIKYITDKPRNPYAYFYLINFCKYFYYKNHIIVADRAQSSSYNEDDEFWQICFDEVDETPLMKWDNFPCKLWITETLECSQLMDINELLPKIYRCDANTPDLIGQSISFKDFLFISSSVEELTLKSVEICYDDGKPVMLETIFNENITIFQYEFESNDPITFESMKHISQLPTHKNFKEFTIEGIPEAFDFDAFINFFESHQETYFGLAFCEVSEETKTKINAFMDMLIQTPNAKCWINFPGIGREKMQNLQNRYFDFLRKK